MEKSMHLTFASDIESSDQGRRLISGVVLPFNKIGNTSAGPVIFETGSVQIPEARRVKLLAQHNQTDPIGRAQSFQVTQDAIYGVFKISASSKGQDYLTLAAEELISSLSIGVDVLKAQENADGVLVVSSAVMKEVSLVESPAYADAVVTKVAASESEAVEEATPIDPTTESEATLDVKAPEPTDTPAEATTPTVEAARPIITAPYNTQTVRHGITSMGRYTEHKIKASLGNDESRLWVTAADDSFTTNPAFSPNQYLRNVVSNTNFGRSTIDACTKAVLPAEGMNVIVPTLVTSAGGGNGVAPVVTVEPEAGAVQNTGMVTEFMSATVSKYSGMNTMSIELIERSGPAFYDQLTLQLQRAYLKATNAAAITYLTANSTNASTTGADAAGLISYASTQPVAAYKATSYFAQNYVGGTSHWSTLLGATDTTGRPIFNAQYPMNAGGLATPTGIKGNVLGLNFSVDVDLPSTTIDGSAFIIVPEAVTIFESPQAYMSVNVVSNLQVQVAIYGFMAPLVTMTGGVRTFNLT
jgi:HK97 family phage prohead protease